MPFHTNTSQNTVIYSSPTWETSVVQNDIELGDTLTATTGIIDPFKIALGKYERVIGEVNLFYTSDANNELQFRFQNVDSADAYVDTILTYGVVGIIGDIADAGGTVSANLEGGMNQDAGDFNNTGQGSHIHVVAGAADSPLSANIKFSAIGNEGKQGTLSFQASNLSAQTGAAVIKAGSWINYKRF